jgi:two-component system chemotaxis response regulator CheB
MAGRDIVVIGASAGGVEALSALVGDLPAELPAAVLVVLHVAPHGTSGLPRILSRCGRLPARHPDDGEVLVPGRIYVAPPDVHLIVRDGHIGLSRGPRENGHRPAVDALFRSAAVAYGPRVVGVVLSGALDDGTAGAAAIKARGGVVLVQNPDDALYPGMPRSVIGHLDADEVAPVATLARAIVDRLGEPVSVGKVAMAAGELDRETELTAFELDAIEATKHPGTPSGFACPDCGGALWELHGDDLIRFRCRVGHAWTSHSLLAEQSEALETALWTALRALEERAALALRLAARLRGGGNEKSARYFDEQAEQSKQRAAALRQLLVSEPRTEFDPPRAAGEPASEPPAGPKGSSPDG